MIHFKLNLESENEYRIDSIISITIKPQLQVNIQLSLIGKDDLLKVQCL